MYYILFRHRHRTVKDFLLWVGFETVERAIDYSKHYETRFPVKIIEVEGGQAGRYDEPRRHDSFWMSIFPNINAYLGGTIKYDSNETMQSRH